MANYQARLDRLEETIAPRRGSPHCVFAELGQSNDDAIAAYAARIGIAAAEVHANVILARWASAPLEVAHGNQL